MLCSCSQIDNTVIKPCFHFDNGLLSFHFLFLFVFFFFIIVIEFIVGNFSTSIGNLQRKTRSGSIDDEKLNNLKLNLLRAALDGLFRFDNLACNINNALWRNSLKVLDHFLRGILSFENTRLESCKAFS